MKRGFATPLILIAVVLAVVIGVAAAIAWQTAYFDSALPSAIKSVLGLEESPPLIESSIEIPSETPEDPTKDWKSYAKKILNTEIPVFSFKYPNDWYIYSVTIGLEEIVTVASRERIEDESGVTVRFPEDATVFDIAYVGDFTGNFDAYIRERWAKDAVVTAGVRFGERNWVEVTSEQGASGPRSLLFLDGTDNQLYRVTISSPLNGEISELAEIIISTIKFL